VTRKEMLAKYDEDLEMRVDEVAEAYRQVVDEIVEKELGLNE